MAGHHQFLPGIDWGDYSDDEDYATIADLAPPELRLAIRVVLSTPFVSGHRGDVLLVEQNLTGCQGGSDAQQHRLAGPRHTMAALTPPPPSLLPTMEIASVVLFTLHGRRMPSSPSQRCTCCTSGPDRARCARCASSCVVDLYHLSTAILGATFKVLLAHNLERTSIRSGCSSQSRIDCAPPAPLPRPARRAALRTDVATSHRSRSPHTSDGCRCRFRVSIPCSCTGYLSSSYPPTHAAPPSRGRNPKRVWARLPDVLLLGWAVCVAVTPFFVRAIQAVGPIIWGLLLLPKWSLLISWCALARRPSQIAGTCSSRSQRRRR